MAAFTNVLRCHNEELTGTNVLEADVLLRLVLVILANEQFEAKIDERCACERLQRIDVMFPHDDAEIIEYRGLQDVFDRLRSGTKQPVLPKRRRAYAKDQIEVCRAVVPLVEFEMQCEVP